MKRFIAVLVLGAFVGVVAGCCDCDKKAGETWGPGLMHWSGAASAKAHK